MRIAVITTSYPTHDGDPAGHFVQAEVEALCASGHEVTVLAPRASQAAPHHPSDATVTRGVGPAPIVWLRAGGAFGWPGAIARLRSEPWRAWGVLSFVVAARQWLRHNPCDRVQAHWLVPCGFPIATAAGNARREIVVHGSDARLLLSLPSYVRQHVLERATRGEAELRFVSSALCDELLASTPLDLASRCSVRPSPVAVPRTTRVEARARLGLANAARIAVVVGRLIASKRVDLALRQQPLSRPFSWFVIGDGPEFDALRRSHPSVSFLGRRPRDEALLWIAAADVLVNASAAEGAPTVVREARALGTRVLTSAVGDVAVWARADEGIDLIPEPEQETPPRSSS